MADISITPRSDVIEGYTLMPLRLPAFAQLRRHFEATHLRIAAIAAEGQSESVAQRIMEKASKDIREGEFAYGTRGFGHAMLADDNLDVLLCSCLKEKHPEMTLGKASRLITHESRSAIHSACLECAGWDLSEKKAQAQDAITPP
jgi:hypothetical protein